MFLRLKAMINSSSTAALETSGKKNQWVSSWSFHLSNRRVLSAKNSWQHWRAGRWRGELSFGVSESFSCFSSLLSIQFFSDGWSFRGFDRLNIGSSNVYFSLFCFALRAHVLPTPCLVPCSALIVFVFKRKIKHPPLLNQHHLNKGVVSFSFSSLLAFNQTKTHIAVSNQKNVFVPPPLFYFVLESTLV